MIENNNLSASELLTAFVDGELESSESQMLFYQLANDSVLQEEMQELIKIRTTFKNSTMHPPPYMRSKILDSTVYSNSFVRRFALIPAFLIPVIFNKVTAVVSSVFLIGLFSYLFVYDSNQSEADTIKGDIPKVSSFDLPPAPESNITSLTNIRTEKIDNLANNNKSDNSSSFSETANEDYSFNSLQDEMNNSEDKSKATAIYNVGLSNGVYLYNESLVPGIERKDYIKFYNLKSRMNYFLHNLSVSFNKQALYSSPNPSLTDEEHPVLNDFSVNMQYHFNDNHSIGLDVGREYFPMIFIGTEKVGNREIEYEYPLSYNALWGGISYRYSFDALKFYYDLQPYTKFTIGGTSLGPVAKLSLGSNIHLSDNFAVYAGLKYGALFYSHQGNLFVTNKYGLDYGLIIRF